MHSVSSFTFSIALILALIAVVLLAVFSSPRTDHNRAVFSFYVQDPQSTHQSPAAAQSAPLALTFHRRLTEGPEKTSREIGKAQGFIIPVERFAKSPFNVIYLTFDTAKYLGSVSIEGKGMGQNKEVQELGVVGGTGSFAFARGRAVLTRLGKKKRPNFDAAFRIDLQLKLPDGRGLGPQSTSG